MINVQAEYKVDTEEDEVVADDCENMFDADKVDLDLDHRSYHPYVDELLHSSNQVQENAAETCRMYLITHLYLISNEAYEVCDFTNSRCGDVITGLTHFLKKIIGYSKNNTM